MSAGQSVHHPVCQPDRLPIYGMLVVLGLLARLNDDSPLCDGDCGSGFAVVFAAPRQRNGCRDEAPITFSHLPRPPQNTNYIKRLAVLAEAEPAVPTPSSRFANMP